MTTTGKLRDGNPIDYLDATDSATAAPTGAGLRSGQFARVRTFVAYADQVDACNVRLWINAGGVWYRGGSTDDFDPLDPGGASAVNESRDWLVGKGSEIAFQIESISGGGTAALSVQGVDE